VCNVTVWVTFSGLHYFILCLQAAGFKARISTPNEEIRFLSNLWLLFKCPVQLLDSTDYHRVYGTLRVLSHSFQANAGVWKQKEQIEALLCETFQLICLQLFNLESENLSRYLSLGYRLPTDRFSITAIYLSLPETWLGQLWGPCVLAKGKGGPSSWGKAAGA
jgi:hypothetical protein